MSFRSRGVLDMLTHLLAASRGLLLARSSADAPEIDGLVYIDNGQQLNVGDFVEVRITDSNEHDLWAEMIS